MKLQLDRSALEYLFEKSGDDFKLELQSAVVQQFANRYLKALVTDDLIVEAKAQVRQAIEAAKNEITAQIRESIGQLQSDYMTGVRLIKMHPDVEHRIREIAYAKKDEVIEEIYTKAAGSVLSMGEVEARIDSAIKLLVQKEYAKQISEHVRKKIADQVINPL